MQRKPRKGSSSPGEVKTSVWIAWKTLRASQVHQAQAKQEVRREPDSPPREMLDRKTCDPRDGWYASLSIALAGWGRKGNARSVRASKGSDIVL